MRFLRVHESDYQILELAFTWYGPANPVFPAQGNRHSSPGCTLRGMKKLRLLRVCDVPLSEMTPVSGGHHCHHCEKMVFDLRRATYAEARAIGRRKDATPCVRYIPDQDGYAKFRTGAVAVGTALIAATSFGCDAATRIVVDETLEHAAHLGETHTDSHTEDYGLAGEPPPEFFEEEVPQPGPELEPEPGSEPEPEG